jgi:hypothetical protein
VRSDKLMVGILQDKLGSAGSEYGLRLLSKASRSTLGSTQPCVVQCDLQVT